MNGFNALRYVILLFLVVTIVTSSCKKEEVTALETGNSLHFISLEVPSNFPQAIPDLDNPLTAEGIELGRKLFYDVRLSGNNKISCASCHQQQLAFSDGIALSNAGESGKKLERHSPVLFNLVWAQTGLFWDGGSKNLESQAFGPLTNADEMNQDLFELEAELKQVPDYVKSFKLVFNDVIKSVNVVKALSQFQRTLISGNSHYDKVQRKENGAMLSTLELQGLNLVKSKCSGCHSGELFTDNSFHNNGINAVFTDDQEGIYQGRFRVSFNAADVGKFKTPTLRNVMLTAPFMHDGRFNTIIEVLDHYQMDIQFSATLDRLLFQNQGKPGIPITTEEKQAIIAFLETLTDNEFITNKKISNPN